VEKLDVLLDKVAIVGKKWVSIHANARITTLSLYAAQCALAGLAFVPIAWTKEELPSCVDTCYMLARGIRSSKKFIHCSLENELEMLGSTTPFHNAVGVT